MQMQGLRALVGRERSVREVAQTLHFAARAVPASAFGAMLVTCADESENECAEAFQQGFAQYLLPPLKFARHSPFRLANLGGRYEWAAARLAEAHYATAEAERGFKFVAVKINSHVSYAEIPVSGRHDPTTPKPFKLGSFERYGRTSTCCGALAGLLAGDHRPGVEELLEAFESEGHDRLDALRDPQRVEARYAPLYAAIVSARLQARKALLDIQDYTPVTPTYWVVLPCVTINRPERDTEIVCGIYTVDGRSGGTDAVYYGLGDLPDQYTTTIAHSRFSVEDGELGQERAGRDHREMIRAALRERLTDGKIKVHDERLEQVRAEVAQNRHLKKNQARHLLRMTLPVLAEVAPVPAAMLAFADGAAGIHHTFKIHQLAREMKGSNEARRMLDELEGRIDELDGDRAVALLELLVSEYK
jgi:hypothetical protein